MPKFSGKTMKSSSGSKRHFTVVIDSKEHGLYISSTPSSAARKAVTKLCASNKGKKVEFHIREITQGSKKKTYGPYSGYIEKLKEPIELKGRVIKYKPITKLKKGGMKGGEGIDDIRISIGNCEREAGFFDFSKNCIVLSYKHRKITIFYDRTSPNNDKITVRYFNDIKNHNFYYKIERYSVNTTSFIQFSNIIGKLTNNEVLVDQFATYNLIEKIMNLINLNHKFSMIYNWLENILPQTKHLNITKSNIPLMVQMNHPKIDKNNLKLSILQQIKENRQQANAEQRQRLYQVMQSFPDSSKGSNPNLMFRRNFTNKPSRLYNDVILNNEVNND